MAAKQYVHIMLRYINSWGDVLNCSLTEKLSGSGYNIINPVALYLQAVKLPHQTFDIQQLVAAEKVLINVLLYIVLIQIFNDRLVYNGRYHVLHLLLHILPVRGFYCLSFATVWFSVTSHCMLPNIQD